ncbi:TIGR03085 family metal-binding protein [Frankia sp. CiP3]|uniref:TIGR03085 family metal-binding protein n=2 Tax=Frankia TaxID=1854 RepID=UPI0027E19985|nr:TIGR03085 family metal-binding protein [Frankia sp. CiP3]
MSTTGPEGTATTEKARAGERDDSSGTSLPEMIKASHDAATHLVGLTFTEAATSGDPRRALRAADTAVAVISAHMYAVQTSVYPMARRRLPDSRPRIAELCAQGRETASVLRGISQYIQGDVHRPDESMGRLRERLAELEEQHIAAEEALVADLDKALSPDDRRRMATAFRRSMRRAPTRPHPHLPRTAVVGSLVLRLAGSWDHILDTMDARIAADGPVRAPAPAGLWGWYLLGRPVPPPVAPPPVAPPLSGRPPALPRRRGRGRAGPEASGGRVGSQPGRCEGFSIACMGRARAQRVALADLLDEVGPAQATLCAGWTAHDLVAHLVTRDRVPYALPGFVIKSLHGVTAMAERATMRGDTFPDLVRIFRDGPPWWHPTRFGLVDDAANLVEFFVHHEDVRRARPGWSGSQLDDGMQRALWRSFQMFGRAAYRRSAVGVVAERADGPGRVVLRRGAGEVTLVGNPAELLLFAFGRRDHAVVDVHGDNGVVAAFTGGEASR